ncbi:hypothetical protein [Saccharopolyspora sp. CA-218241]|uniref:hypothetical protein n=1 Tax=Saccharopolyspora sp. CA-218241 TaxID=3240027 RepID=UPI003D9561B5
MTNVSYGAFHRVGPPSALALVEVAPDATCERGRTTAQTSKAEAADPARHPNAP